MSGHSKWANIKHKKAKVDAQRGNMFTKISKEITVAARNGGGNPEANFRLKLAIQKAREANIPNDNITRAIQRGTGELEGTSYEEIVYEGYGPGGTAILLEVLTDNRNRTVGEIRYLFSRHGGNLGESGCVAWMFDKKGLFVIDKETLAISEDELMDIILEAGADDMKTEEGEIEITCGTDVFEILKETLEKNGITLAAAEITMLPQTTLELTDNDAAKAFRLAEVLENHDDVQNVYTNFTFDEAIMEDKNS
ncbi:MAG: YebC/PmpR family DNA-binding transcriptional regulator [bacterium]